MMHLEWILASAQMAVNQDTTIQARRRACEESAAMDLQTIAQNTFAQNGPDRNDKDPQGVEAVARAYKIRR
jgi:hypothetical protein